MKKIIFIAAMLVFPLLTYAEHDVTTFFGIPVDGSKQEMFDILKSKGFRSTPTYSDVFTGTIDGREVNIFVKTINRKVYRIMVADARTDTKENVRNRFNEMLRQYASNPEYVASADNAEISEKEDLSREHFSQNKRYTATFYQKPSPELYKKDLTEYLRSLHYTKEQIANPTDEMMVLMEKYYEEHLLKKSVWFAVQYFHGEYYLSLYFDNNYNRK